MTQENLLNGLPQEKLKEVLDSFKDPEVFNAVTGPWKSRVVWQDGMRAKAYMRTHMVEMDEPGDLTATDVAASAHEQLLSAIGSCMTVGFVINATKRGVKIHDLEIAVEGYFDNIRVWAGVEGEGNPGYGKISAKAFVRADADESVLKEIWKLAVDGSPVTQTIRHGNEVETELEVIG
ncbi:MAG: OsmC family protein [Chloroflexi bacterium]|nr:OsmC family protein [Chloroflexota bacterium]